MTATEAPLVACPSCGAAAAAGDRFCEACGANLPDTGTAPPLVDDADEVESDDAKTEAPTAPEAPTGPPCPHCGGSTETAADGYCGTCGMKLPLPRDHIEVTYPGVAAVTDRGIRHPRNEDSFALSVADGRVVALVCDGVSSTVNPDQASQAAADVALAVILSPDGPTDPEARLTAAHAAAQAAVLAVPGDPQPPRYGWPSCTFLAGVVTGSVFDLATLGDCRSIWLPVAGGEPDILTVDDSWAEEKISDGSLTMDEAYEHPRAHQITRWLGRDADPGWTPRYVRFDAPGPGRLVLCSDGLWNYALTAADVAAAAGEGDALAVAQRLVTFANEAGGADNITVVVIDVGLSEDAGPSPAASSTESTESTGVDPAKGSP